MTAKKNDRGKPAYQLIDTGFELGWLASKPINKPSADVLWWTLRGWYRGEHDSQLFDMMGHAAGLLCQPTPRDAMLQELAEVLAFGAKKYDAWNWTQGFEWSRLYGAACRHLAAFCRGEIRDPESGLHHLGHFGCCLMFLHVHEREKLGTDDRFRFDVQPRKQDWINPFEMPPEQPPTDITCENK